MDVSGDGETRTGCHVKLYYARTLDHRCRREWRPVEWKEDPDHPDGDDSGLRGTTLLRYRRRKVDRSFMDPPTPVARERGTPEDHGVLPGLRNPPDPPSTSGMESCTGVR